MKTYKASQEFKLGKHNIGYLYNFEQFKDETFEQRPMPTYQLLPRDMTDAEIENELTKGQLCTLGDILTFLDNAPEECKDGYVNLFYLKSWVAHVSWYSDRRRWRVRTFTRDGRRWLRGRRVLSPATSTVKLGGDASDANIIMNTPNQTNRCCPSCADSQNNKFPEHCHDETCSCHTPAGEAIKENLRLSNNGLVYNPHTQQKGWENKIWMWATNAFPHQDSNKIHKLIGIVDSHLTEQKKRVVEMVEERISHWRKVHDEAMPDNTLIGYHADSCIRALTNVLTKLEEI